MLLQSHTRNYTSIDPRPQIAKTNFCVINVESSVTSARNSRQFVWMPLLHMGTQQWHHVHSPKVGRPSLPLSCNGTQQWHHSPKVGRFPSPPTTAHNNGSNGTTPPNLAVMAPSNGTTSTPPRLVATLAHYNGTLRWHAMAPRPKVGRHPPLPPSTLQWHLTVARNGTTSTPRKLTTTPPKLVVTLRSATIAHYNGTLQWHPGATSNPPKWFVGLPPIGSKNPYSYRYLGKKP